MRREFSFLALALASMASADPLGTRTSPASYDASPVGFGPVVQMLFALALVGAGIKFALPALMKRFGGRISTQANGTIRIEESAAFPGGRLYVVEARGRTLLLGATGQNVSCLADLTTNDFAEALIEAEKPAPADPLEQLARLERLGA
jgi:flagellar biogenesis protein FliO